MNPLTRRRLLQQGAAAAAAALLASCNDDGAAPTTTGAPSTTGGAPSSTSSPTTTAGTPTVPSSTTTTSTIAPATTVAPPPDSLVDAIPAGAIDDLRTRLGGEVLTPEDPAYATSGLTANTRYSGIRPAVIAQCADEADVVTCVRWAVENGVQPVGRGGGHSYAGLSTTTGLLIDITALNKVTLDRSTGQAVVGGSAFNSDLLTATINSPWLLPGGTCLSVGTGGLVLGGGIGYNARWAGLTCDHLTASRIVTAAGEVLEIDSTKDPDLFWACRGGTGGTFGINTEFTFQLIEVPATVTYFRYDFEGADEAAAVLAEFNRICATGNSGINPSYMAQATPVGASGPRGAIACFARGQYVGPASELQDLLAPMLKAATPTKTAFEERPFWDVQANVWASQNPTPHAFGDHSRYVKEPVPDDAVAKMIDLLAECPQRDDDNNGSIWSLGWVGGDVMNKPGRTDTAYVHRGASTLLRPTPVWAADAPQSVGDELVAWTEQVIAVIDPHTPRESYQNFPNRAITDPQQVYFAENLDRLIDVKTKYDPTNLFRNAQSVAPR
jgi:FAD/FMN-containing dehydrogenase